MQPSCADKFSQMRREKTPDAIPMTPRITGGKRRFWNFGRDRQQSGLNLTDTRFKPGSRQRRKVPGNALCVA